MADQLLTTHTTGKTVYAQIRAVDGTIADVAAQAFEVYATGSIGNYDVVMAEQGAASKHYAAAFPAWIPPGMYTVTYFERLTGSPLETDTIIETQVVHWMGSKFVTLADLWAASLGATLWDYTLGQLKIYDGRGYEGGNGTVVATLTVSSPAPNKTLQS